MKKTKIITIILAIILVTLAAFGGVYIKTQNRMENKVNDYILGRQLYGERQIEVKVATSEESKPKEEDLTIENYETVKKTIENRLKNFGQQDYTISLNKDNGTIVVEMPENANTDTYAYILTAPSKVQINEKDGEKKELLSDSMIEKALYTYTADREGNYQVYVDLYLTQEGQVKIEEIKNNYAIFEAEVSEIEKAQEESEKDESEGEEVTSENEEVQENTEKNEEQVQTRAIAELTIAGTNYDIEKIEKNKISIKIGGATSNSSSINNNMAAASEIATLISSGKFPIEYEIGENRFVFSDITEKQMLYGVIAFAIVMLIVFVVFIVKYKVNGLLVSISFVGFTAILSLILRYTNVSISIEGIAAIIITMVINIIVNQKLLENGNDMNYKELSLNIIPVVIIALVFSFTKWSNLNSFGMIMFWGLALIALYNLAVTKTLLKLRESK